MCQDSLTAAGNISFLIVGAEKLKERLLKLVVGINMRRILFHVSRFRPMHQTKIWQLLPHVLYLERHCHAVCWVVVHVSPATESTISFRSYFQDISCMNFELTFLGSGGFRGYAGYAAAYPIDWTGCIFVTFNFCPIICNWIFGHRIIPCVPAWVQKQNTEHALMTEADTDRSLQLDQGHGTPIWRAAMLTNQYAFEALLPAVEMYQAFIDESYNKLRAEFEL